MHRAFALAPLAFLAATLAGSTALPRPQDPDDVDPEVEVEQDAEGVHRDIFGRMKRHRGRDPFEGAWQLVDMSLEGYPEVGLYPTGYLLIADGFMAFQLQAFYDEDEAGEEYEDGFQTFFCEYTVVGGDTLLCTTLIGAYLDEEVDVVDYEPEGMEREFLLEQGGGMLTLRWGEDDLLTFGRLHHRDRAKEDIFGNQVRIGPRGDDVFGRRKADDDDDGDGGDGDDGGDDD